MPDKNPCLKCYSAAVLKIAALINSERTAVVMWRGIAALRLWIKKRVDCLGSHVLIITVFDAASRSESQTR